MLLYINATPTHLIPVCKICFFAYSYDQYWKEYIKDHVSSYIEYIRDKPIHTIAIDIAKHNYTYHNTEHWIKTIGETVLSDLSEYVFRYTLPKIEGFAYLTFERKDELLKKLSVEMDWNSFTKNNCLGRLYQNISITSHRSICEARIISKIEKKIKTNHDFEVEVDPYESSYLILHDIQNIINHLILQYDHIDFSITSEEEKLQLHRLGLYNLIIFGKFKESK